MLGSGFSRSADFILPLLEGKPSKHCLRPTELRTSTLGDESVALGGLRLALDDVDNRLLSAQLAAPRAPIG
ncbi:hypothetical protein GCM10023323_22180 [Streptomyces thinghirensis]|uniref:ROK family protein n=1 Tax=Streptomyces thinghirensis TaxID=551547 RepID=A0ABP9SZE5_9ACTN